MRVSKRISHGEKDADTVAMNVTYMGHRSVEAVFTEQFFKV